MGWVWTRKDSFGQMGGCSEVKIKIGLVRLKDQNEALFV